MKAARMSEFDVASLLREYSISQARRQLTAAGTEIACSSELQAPRGKPVEICRYEVLEPWN